MPSCTTGARVEPGIGSASSRLHREPSAALLTLAIRLSGHLKRKLQPQCTQEILRHYPHCDWNALVWRCRFGESDKRVLA
jgi:hypothetical protein